MPWKADSSVIVVTKVGIEHFLAIRSWAELAAWLWLVAFLISTIRRFSHAGDDQAKAQQDVAALMICIVVMKFNTLLFHEFESQEEIFKRLCNLPDVLENYFRGPWCAVNL